jgi:hypothetical protein
MENTETDLVLKGNLGSPENRKRYITITNRIEKKWEK